MALTTSSVDRHLFVFWDGVLLRKLHKASFARDPFFRGVFASKEEFLERFFEHERKVALRVCLKRLSQRAMHSQTLSRQLLEYGFSQEAVSWTIAKAIENKWLRDESYMELFLDDRKRRGKSRLETYAALKIRNIGSGSLIAGYSDVEALTALIPKKYPKLLDPAIIREEREKLFARICRKGFSINDLKKALLRLLASPEVAD